MLLQFDLFNGYMAECSRVTHGANPGTTGGDPNPPVDVGWKRPTSPRVNIKTVVG